MTRVRLKPIAEPGMVVTAASPGIGQVTARTAGGARGPDDTDVVGCGDTGREEPGERAAFTVADIGDRDAVEAAAQGAVDRFGRIDTWLHVAGVAIYAKLLDTPMDEHERLFRTNYYRVVRGAPAAIPRLRDPSRVPSLGDNLHRPLRSGAERSANRSGHRVSLC
ncbi:SDR family NAD(P)-dependent oxidoreductase [uncultured Sphingomonas sp.]|uniref:SDR family NAD(P)-dependent oxidoreductase n=1 Tax=uncultured Sphingomonas sp. TaxID=158754 RepID=UPI0025DE2ABC|nr:SDR family NAD(P)-dependent oxidoreductase [uncultured Sphingomonas sp.]